MSGSLLLEKPKLNPEKPLADTAFGERPASAVLPEVVTLRDLEGISTLENAVASASNACTAASHCGSCYTRSCSPNC